MFRYLVIVFVFIFAVLALMYFWIGVPKVYRSASPELNQPYIYNNPEQSIKDIRIAAFYFVPRNKAKLQIENWKQILEAGLQELREFHSLQFQGLSAVSYEIYADPIIGLEDNLSYDTEVTQRGNPRALINIAEELEARVFRLEGDLFSPDFAKHSESAYPVLFIMYEGVGASGGVIYESELESVSDIAREVGLPESVIFKVNVESTDGFFLVNREFLAGTHGPAGTSVFAHEFYHTIGVSDGYDEETAVAQTPDIMGLGRTKPLDKTYLSNETLSHLGL